ncbi:MAG: hypothetical protein KKG99_09815 [Bacteroidetes bacterium]|nr:hypothetical protein [Bacteroidota bacterium]
MAKLDEPKYGAYYSKRIIEELGIDDHLNSIWLYGFLNRKYQDQIFSKKALA